jgi:hypothetical protein
MDIKKKFLEVLDGVDFRYGAPVDSPEQLVKYGEHIIAQYEALGEARQQRGEDLICAILADVLQPRALARYGDASYDSIRRVLIEECALATRTKWEKYIELGKQAIANLGLNDFQVEQLNKYFDLMPDIFVEFIADLASRFDLFPRENAATFAMVLRDMLKEEVDHVESKRYN